MNLNASFFIALAGRAEKLEPESKKRCTGLPLIFAVSPEFPRPGTREWRLAGLQQ